MDLRSMVPKELAQVVLAEGVGIAEALWTADGSCVL
jgi:hypothetical protein